MSENSSMSPLPVVVGLVVLVGIVWLGIYFATGKVAEEVAGVPLYPGEPVSVEPVSTPSGLKYYELEEGTGATPAGPSSEVRVHYTGYLTSGKKFDSSHDRGEPATFALNRVIAGWTEGVGSMKEGGKRKLIVPPDLGYGPGGSPPSIPPNATLVFDVELIEVLD